MALSTVWTGAARHGTAHLYANQNVPPRATLDVTSTDPYAPLQLSLPTLHEQPSFGELEYAGAPSCLPALGRLAADHRSTCRAPAFHFNYERSIEAASILRPPRLDLSLSPSRRACRDRLNIHFVGR